MKLKEAIEDLEIQVRVQQTIDNPRRAEALKLGIEALKRTHARRERLSWKLESLLPGETT